MKAIEKIVIRKRVDDSPDTSYYGEYTSQWKEGAIDRKELGDMGRGEYRYFIPAMTGHETGNPESPMQDYKRMEALSQGDWCFLGIDAIAHIRIGDLSQEITSGGLWGIESDSGDDYLQEVAKEQLEELREQLSALGFSEDAIDLVFPDSLAEFTEV